MSLLSSLAGSIGGVASGIFNWASAKSNQSFQAEQSSTAHQREVNDLKAAGLNPVLSAGGSGSSTPVGAVARADNPAAGLSENMMVGSQKATAKAQADNLTAEANLKRAQLGTEYAKQSEATANAENMHEQANVTRANLQSTLLEQGLTSARTRQTVKSLGLTDAQIRDIQSSVYNRALEGSLTSARTAQTQAETHSTELEQSKLRAQSDMYDSKAGHVLPWVKEVLGDVSSASGSVGSGLGAAAAAKYLKGRR